MANEPCRSHRFPGELLWTPKDTLSPSRVLQTLGLQSQRVKPSKSGLSAASPGPSERHLLRQAQPHVPVEALGCRWRCAPALPLLESMFVSSGA